MHCTNCGFDNAKEARFCSQCGTPLQSICQSCGTATEPTDRFCKSCGTRLPSANHEQAPPSSPHPSARIEGERREVTVLFGDITGFTALSHELDPEETHALLNRYFETVDGVVRKYGGTIDKHIGDSIMAVFGAPVAHSDDPERAMRAALDIHSALKGMEPPLSAHIGIAAGTVVASSTGSEAHREYTVIGDTVNLAARLQDRAGPGETLMSGAVHRAGAARFESVPIGDVTIKGLSEPVAVWRLIGLAEMEDVPGRQIFVGRRAELRKFIEALECCLTQGTGQTLVVMGEPGIGKTRLLQEFRILAEGRNFAWHRGLVLDFGVGKGLDAIAAVICGMLNVSLNAKAAEKSFAESRAVSERLIDAEQTVYLNDLLALPQPTGLRSLYDAMNEDTRTSGKERFIADMVRKSASSSPIVIAIEDVHWADGAILSYLARVAATCAVCPAVLVMTTRIAGNPIDAAWSASIGEAPLKTVDLGPLPVEEALAFVSENFKASEGVAETYVKRSGGNPLFLEQLLLGAREALEGEIPGSIQSVVLARMDNLAPLDRHALQAASVLGQRFSLHVLRHLIDQPDYDGRTLAEHLLVRPDGHEFMFAHALVRDGVYSSLLKARRTALHKRAADWFAMHDLVLRAEHLDRAEDAGAAEAYLAAAREESRNYHNDSALRLSERGLALADRTVRHAIACFRGDLLLGLGEVEKSIASFEDALSADEDDLARSVAWVGLAEGMRVSDRHGEAFDALDNAARTAANGPPLLLAEIHHLRGNLYFPAGRYADCLAQHERALKFAREAGSQEWEARALGGLGDASYLAGRMHTACRHFRDCVELCRQLGLGRIEVSNRHMIGWSRIYLNEIAEAGEDGLAAAEMAERVGQNRAEMLSRMLAAYMHVERNQLEAAREQAEKTIALARRLGSRNFLAQGLCLLAKTHMAENRSDAARADIDEALGSLRRVGMTFIGPFVLGVAARLSDDASRRASLLAEAEQILGQSCVSHNYFWFYREAMEAALEYEQWPEVVRYSDAMERYASREPLPWSDLFVARGRALACFGQGERNPQLSAELQRIATIAKDAGFINFLPPLARAIASG